MWSTKEILLILLVCDWVCTLIFIFNIQNHLRLSFWLHFLPREQKIMHNDKIIYTMARWHDLVSIFVFHFFSRKLSISIFLAWIHSHFGINFCSMCAKKQPQKSDAYQNDWNLEVNSCFSVLNKVLHALQILKLLFFAHFCSLWPHFGFFSNTLKTCSWLIPFQLCHFQPKMALIFVAWFEKASVFSSHTIVLSLFNSISSHFCRISFVTTTFSILKFFYVHIY